MSQPIEIVALSKLIATKEAKGSLYGTPDGKHEVDFSIHVYGSLDIKSSDKTSTCSIPLLKALALCLHYSGCTRNNLMIALEKAIKHSMTADQEEIATLLGMEWKDIAALEKRIKDEVVAKLPKTDVRRCNAKLHYSDIIEETELELQRAV